MAGSRRKKRATPDSARPNSLGLRRDELYPLLDRLDFSWPESQARAQRRGFVRWPYRLETLELRVKHPGGSRTAIRVACRNLSRAGLSVLHSTYIHPGTRCVVLLPRRSREETPVPGSVARCTHRSGIVHEIGIRFDRELDTREFVAHDPFADSFSVERVEPERLAGRVVCIAPAPADHRIIALALRDSRITLVGAPSAAEGLARVREGCDALFCDLKLPDATGLELVASLRARGMRTPAIILTAEKNAALRRAVGELHVDAFLLKPPDPVMVLRAAAEYLLVRPSGTPAPQPAPHGLFELTVASLALCAAELEQAVLRDDLTGVRTVCERIAAAGPTGSFASARLLAMEAAAALGAVQRVRDAVEPLKSLVRACREAPVRRGV